MSGAALVTRVEVEAAVAELRQIIQLDGVDLVLSSVDSDVASFRLILEDASCADCVLPRDRLEVLLVDRLEEAKLPISKVVIDDPREAAPAEAGLDLGEPSGAAMRLRLPSIVFAPRATTYAKRLPTLAGARIGLLDAWGDQENGGGMYPTFAEMEKVLLRDHGVAEVIWQMKSSTSHELPESELRGFAGRVDAVINGEGLCGSCTAATVLDGVLLEGLGMPSVTLVQAQFEKAARMHARAGGLADLPLFVEPEPVDGSSVQRDGAFVEANIQRVVDALTQDVVVSQ
jgi:hypothetical protein